MKYIVGILASFLFDAQIGTVDVVCCMALYGKYNLTVHDIGISMMNMYVCREYAPAHAAHA